MKNIPFKLVSVENIPRENLLGKCENNFLFLEKEHIWHIPTAPVLLTKVHLGHIHVLEKTDSLFTIAMEVYASVYISEFSVIKHV